MTQTTIENKKVIKVNYQNWSTAIFEGFYESHLFNSDILYDINYNDRCDGYLEEDEEWDFADDSYKKFEHDVSNKAVELLEEIAVFGLDPDNRILDNFTYKNLASPAYYNYSTDKLNIDMDVNIHALERFCFSDNKDNFNKYLNDNFTSYDGFISYIDNNIDDFRFTYNSKGTDSVELDVMIEYYLLTRIYDTIDLSKVTNRYTYGYHYDLIEYANECLYEYISKVKI